MSAKAESKDRLVPKLYTTSEVCELLAMSRPTLEGFVNRGQIIPVRDGRWVRYSEFELDRFVMNLQRRAIHLEPLSMPEFLDARGEAV